MIVRIIDMTCGNIDDLDESVDDVNDKKKNTYDVRLL